MQIQLPYHVYPVTESKSLAPLFSGAQTRVGRPGWQRRSHERDWVAF